VYLKVDRIGLVRGSVRGSVGIDGGGLCLNYWDRC